MTDRYATRVNMVTCYAPQETCIRENKSGRRNLVGLAPDFS